MAQLQTGTNPWDLEWDFNPQLVLDPIIDSDAYLTSIGGGSPQIIIGGSVDDPVLFDLSKADVKLGSFDILSSHKYDSAGSDQSYPYASHTSDTARVVGGQYSGGAFAGAGVSNTYVYSSGGYTDASDVKGSLTYTATPGKAPDTYWGPIKATETLDIKFGSIYGEQYQKGDGGGYGNSDTVSVHIDKTTFGFGDLETPYDVGVKDASGFATNGGAFTADQVLEAGATGGASAILALYTQVPTAYYGGKG